jgi:hypothetical protein
MHESVIGEKKETRATPLIDYTLRSNTRTHNDLSSDPKNYGIETSPFHNRSQ